MNTADNREVLQKLIGDDYRLQWVIGHGGMSTVWLADDATHDREVAIKVLRPEFSDNSEFLSRFRAEAQAAESIDSDNVVRTYDYREVQDPAGHAFCFMALEYVRGESLADLLAREGQLKEDLALDVMEQAAHGLSIIHRMGLVHRDIKPGNLLITQSGQVKITDFGIAKAAAAVPLTRTGMVVGTAQYVSPEQAQGLRVTPASDVYSLGVVGYEMLAGKRPFTGDSSVSVALAHISKEAEPLSTEVSAPARELIGFTLRKDPATRFADGNELANAVSAVRLGQRAPQPKSAALAAPAPEPSPSASTEMLGNVTHPATAHPAAPIPQGAPGWGGAAAGFEVAQRAAQGPQARAKAQKESGRAGRPFGLGLLIAVSVIALLAAGFYAATRFLGTDSGSPESTAPSVVTEWVETTPEETSEEVAPTTTVETVTEAPSTTEVETSVVTTTPEEETSTPGPAPSTRRPQPTAPGQTQAPQPTTPADVPEPTQEVNSPEDPTGGQDSNPPFEQPGDQGGA